MAKLYVYLDIDGALVTKFSKASKIHKGLAWDEVCIENLSKLFSEIIWKFDEIIIVVISNWRYDFSSHELKNLILNAYGLSPYVAQVQFAPKFHDRTAEVGMHCNENIRSNDAFIIIDDAFYNTALSRYQVRTRTEDGIRDYEGVRIRVWDILRSQDREI